MRTDTMLAERSAPIDPWLLRIRGEFLEMPGLRLTRAQARRLWALDAPSCDRALATLVRTGFLKVGPDGAYRRADSR